MIHWEEKTRRIRKHKKRPTKPNARGAKLRRGSVLAWVDNGGSASSKYDGCEVTVLIMRNHYHKTGRIDLIGLEEGAHTARHPTTLLSHVSAY